jgi:predicted benzoate:H+ symporter BenE
VGYADDGIVLTDREREALAGLAESIGDAWLAGQLSGRDHPPPKPAPRRPWWHGLAASRWAGFVALVVGAVLALTTFMHSTIAAIAGLALMGVGMWRLVDDHREQVTRRLTARRTPEG